MTDVLVLPVPGAVTPAAGVGVTYHSGAELLPGTILRAGPRVFWFRIDRDFDGAAELYSGLRDWTHRAILQPDGVWRVGHEMHRVDVGIRRARLEPVPQPASEVERLAAAVDRIEPSLLRRRWYSPDQLVIPSLLESADEILAELAAYGGPHKERVAALHERLTALRVGFRNIGDDRSSAATEAHG
jgi:hypothetical protein